MPDGGGQEGGRSAPGGAVAKGIAIAVVTALLGGAVSYGYGVAEDNRKSRLAYLDAQIERLYGPLYATTQATDAVWNVFVGRHWRGQTNAEGQIVFLDDRYPPTVERIRLWRRWIREVFQPLNLRMVETITANTQLVVGNTMPEPMRLLAAHAHAYTAVMALWSEDELAACPADRITTVETCPALAELRNSSGINYPEALVACVRDQYMILKDAQQALRRSNVLTALLADTTVRRSPSCPG